MAKRNDIKSIIKPVNDAIMLKIYNTLKRKGFTDNQIVSDEECIKLFIRNITMGKTPTIIMEKYTKYEAIFPQSRYKKKTATHRFYLSAKYIKNIVVIK